MTLIKRKIVCEIEFPDDFDACYDNAGINAFHDNIKVSVCSWAVEYCALRKIGSGENQNLEEYARVKLNIMNSLKIVGIIDQNNEFVAWNKDTDTFGLKI